MASQPPRKWTVGKLMPALLAAALVIDIASRFLPIDALTFRSWEALIRHHAPCGLFRANAVYENAASYGDLAAVGNLPQYRNYRREVFSTDELGFRRHADRVAAATSYGLITVGDSFVFGLGLNDEQTLAAQLERTFGVGVYNGAAGTTPAQLADIQRVVTLLKVDQATVIYEYFQEHELPDRRNLINRGEDRVSCDDRKHRFLSWYDGFTSASPLKIVTQQALKRLQNDAILPNTLKRSIAVRRLKNGAPILFSVSEIKRSRQRRTVQTEGLKLLNDELARRGLRFVVLLVPTKYTVYRPLLQDDDVVESDDESYLNSLERSLKQASIPVVNLHDLFRRKAAEGLRRNEYIYWRDDMHWNASGVEIAVGEIARQRQLFMPARAKLTTATR